MSDEKKERSGGLSLQTLLISAGAAVVAATIVPLFWEQGTLFATAMTPVVVALVSEALRKPVERVSAVAPRVARRTGTGAAVRRYESGPTRARDAAGVGARGSGPERFDPLPPDRRADAPVPREDDPYGLRGARRPRPRLRIAVLTGLLAFLAAVAVVTASELALFGGSVSGERGRTTIFGGQEKDGNDRERRPDREAAPAADPGDRATPEPTPSPQPEEEATAEPTPSPTPTPAAPEETATPAPTP